MNSLVWFSLTLQLLVVTIAADVKDSTPELFSDPKIQFTPLQKQLERQQPYKAKEIILYLTPSQIDTLEADQEYGYELNRPQPTRNPDSLMRIQKYKQGLQNNLHDSEGQQLQHEYANLAAYRKQRQQIEDAVQMKQENEKDLAALSKGQQLEEMRLGKYLGFNLQLPRVSNDHPIVSPIPLTVSRTQKLLENYDEIYPQQEDRTQDLQDSRQLQQEKFKSSNSLLVPKQQFQLQRYEYSPDKIAEACQLLAQLGSQPIESQKKEKQQLIAQHFKSIKDLAKTEIKAMDPDKFLTDQLQNVRQRQVQNLKARVAALQTENRNIELEQLKYKLEAENIKAPQMNVQRLVVQNLEKEIFDEETNAKQLHAQSLEAPRFDSELETEQDNMEQQRLDKLEEEWLRDYEQKKSKMEVLYATYIHNKKVENIPKKIKNIPKTESRFEKGLVPIQHEGEIQREKDLAISQELEKIVHKEIKITKQQNDPVINHIHMPIPTPYYVTITEPNDVKVPHPEIVRPYPIPVVKAEQIEVEKPVPSESKKEVPVRTTKNPFGEIEKPETKVQKEKPVEEPMTETQSYTLVKHVWDD